MNDRFFLLNANVGDVLYMRIDGNVNAVKVVNFICGAGATHAVSDASYVTLLVAGKGEETEKLYIGRGSNRKFFFSIEDCINNCNPVETIIYTDKEIAQFCGMNVEGLRTDFGAFYNGVKKFVWDGYMPKLVKLLLSNFIFIKDADGWRFETYKKSYETKAKKYYDTYEECIADNQVKVIVF